MSRAPRMPRAAWPRARCARPAIAALLLLVLVLGTVPAGCGGSGRGASASGLAVFADPALTAPLSRYGSASVQKQAQLNAPKRGYSDPAGGKATLTFGPTAALVARIRRGATPDLLVGSAPLLDALYTAGYIEEPIRFTTRKPGATVIAKRPHDRAIQARAGLPLDIHRRFVTYSIAIVDGTKHEERAKAFMFGLINGNEAGADALLASGFGAPPAIAHRPRKPPPLTTKGL
jgi:ABC-type molybdate transport system substrate-binding protein